MILAQLNCTILARMFKMIPKSHLITLTTFLKNLMEKVKEKSNHMKNQIND